MKRLRVIVALLAGIVAAVVVFVVWPRQREPEYKGRKLSEWLARYARPWDFGEPWERQQEASKAVSYIGTNALLWLMKWIAYDYAACGSLKLDAASLGLAIRDCKERGFAG